MRFRKKPVEINAEQYVEYGKLVKGMCNSQSCYIEGNTEPHVHTIHDNQIVLLEVGDWIIPEPDGIHFYPCKPDIFEMTYEEVDTDIQLCPVCGEEMESLGDCLWRCSNYPHNAQEKSDVIKEVSIPKAMGEE